jgi:tRNA(adenine34) deaminase
LSHWQNIADLPKIWYFSGRMKDRDHEYWMELALREAELALKRDEVPVGAVIVKDGLVIAKGSNQTEMLQDPTAHAEMIALTAAAAHLGSKRLEGCSLYVTLEPCAMCAGAVVLARLPLLIFGAYDPKAGACSTLFTITNDTRLNHRAHTVGGVLEEKCSGILREFFLKKRKPAD